MTKSKQTDLMGDAREDQGEVAEPKRRVNLATESPAETPAETGQGKAEIATGSALPATDKAPATNKAKEKTGIRPEIADLVNELRDAAKRLDPKRHTPSSLRRALGVVSNILDEIGQLDDEPRGAKGKTA
jgi:hypothetical protein